ncbi:MAG: bifunctional (p)ppGpp synthetase/guanosine-3',5'-bis(diphosphate) 3'-pyrophosphohydrolase [Burkholderiaceae bacterium]|nr:bifunctional (p)ppGpp synthetase/guanosine-3',5'-bis(diphosphate) 3'-pyrophosphohydrolase [Burkholderiaceae bacterium]
MSNKQPTKHGARSRPGGSGAKSRPGAPPAGGAQADEPQAQAAGLVARALEFARGRLLSEDASAGNPAALAKGRAVLKHAQGTIGILDGLGVDEPARAVAALFGSPEKIPIRDVEREFGAEVALLVDGMRRLRKLREIHRRADGAAGGLGPEEIEALRRMLLAMTVDIRVVLIRLAVRLQTLREHVASGVKPDLAICRETLEVLAPLANRLGLWQLKWELEDLAFMFVNPEAYRTLSAQLEEKREEREQFVARALERLRLALEHAGMKAELSGRPKHIYSIHAKMRSRRLAFADLRDLRALRVIVDRVDDCYAALGVVHEIWQPNPEEYDDYISRPKPNGYRSLHTGVIAEDGKPLEIQIRTREMHQFAEYGVASHWRYKERTTGASAGKGREAAAPGAQSHDERVTWMRQLLAWQREVGHAIGTAENLPLPQDEHVYVLTPQARVVELPTGATPIDFAYSVHTDLGHRCRGARVDGQLVPLNTALRNGQTVEVISAREGSGSDGPSRDWLNPQLGFVASSRARAKVRQWFNALEAERDAAIGRERIERILQREGRTAIRFETLAARLGYDDPAQMFLAAGRDELSSRPVEEALRIDSRAGGSAPEAAAAAKPETLGVVHRTRRRDTGDGVLVEGIDSLLTQLAKCCRPAPPDEVVGFVTRGRGVSIHRADCPTFVQLKERSPERVIETAWAQRKSGAPESGQTYPVDIEVRASDRQGLLRDVSDAFSRNRINVVGVKTHTKDFLASMRFTAEITDTSQLEQTLGAVRAVPGVISAARR